MAHGLIKRIVKDLLPDLFSKQLAAKEAVIVNVGRLSDKARLDDEFLPAYAVDVRVLDVNGNIDESIPIIECLPLPLNHCGDGGFFGAPSEGIRVVIDFAYGSPSKPYIQTVLSMGSVVPALMRGEMVWSKGDGIEQRIDTAGNWKRETTQDISDSCDTFNLAAREVNETTGRKNSLIKGHWVSKCYGFMKLKAWGSVSWISGGRFNITAAETLNLTALNDINLNTAKKINAHSKEGTTLATDKELNLTATKNAKLTGEKVRVGSTSVDLVAQVEALAMQVSALDDLVKAHTHICAAPDSPSAAPVWVGVKAAVDAIKAEVTKIKT